MSIALEARVTEMEARVKALELKVDADQQLSAEFAKLVLARLEALESAKTTQGKRNG
jgi:hypothetical protein